MLLWTAPFLTLAAILYLSGRYHLFLVLRNWEMVLTPSGRRKIQQLQDPIELNAPMADCAYEAAARARRRRDAAEALRLIELTFSVLSTALRTG